MVDFNRYFDFRTSLSLLNIGFTDEYYFKRIFVTGGYHDFKSNISVNNKFLELPARVTFNFINNKILKSGVFVGYNLLIPLKYEPEDWGEPAASTTYAEPYTPGPFERNSIKVTSLLTGLELAYVTKKRNYIALNGALSFDHFEQDFGKSDEWKTRRLDFRIGYYYFLK